MEAFGHFIISQQGKRKTTFSGLPYITKNWKFSCVLCTHSQFLCSRVANLAFWRQILKFWLFWTPLASLEIKKARKIWIFLDYFQSDRLGSGKTLSELHIHYKSLATRVYYHAGCTDYCKDFTFALKMIDVIDKKQMHDSLITGKEYASED